KRSPISGVSGAKRRGTIQSAGCHERRACTDWDLDATTRQGPGCYRICRQPRIPEPILGDYVMKNKRALPAFKSEAEEAEWWYKNRRRLDKHLLEAAKNGALRRLDQATIKARLIASRQRVVSIRLPEDDIELARRQATQK